MYLPNATGRKIFEFKYHFVIGDLNQNQFFDVPTNSFDFTLIFTLLKNIFLVKNKIKLTKQCCLTPKVKKMKKNIWLLNVK